MAVVFPPVNWPDERRNLSMLDAGGYGVVYGPFQYLLRYLVSGFVQVGSYDSTALPLQIAAGWKPFDGVLRYATVPGDGSGAYYVAKLGNVILVMLAVAAFAAIHGAVSGKAVSREKTYNYCICLMAPAVVYQVVQVSTDTLFILGSVSLYFLERPRSRVIFGVLALGMVVEDRSFVILSLTAIGYGVLPWLLPWSRIKHNHVLRVLMVICAVVAGTAVGVVAAHLILPGGGSNSSLLGTSEISSLSDQVQYTWTKSYNRLESPALLVAGLIYLPSAAEYFLILTPLYLIALLVFVRWMKTVVADEGEAGQRAFYLAISVILVFFGLTNATHVFEHGRYYFSLIPALVVAMRSLIASRAQRQDEGARRATGHVAALFVVLNVLLTTFVALPTILAQRG